jgi:hypothetical protein
MCDHGQLFVKPTPNLSVVIPVQRERTEIKAAVKHASSPAPKRVCLSKHGSSTPIILVPFKYFLVS